MAKAPPRRTVPSRPERGDGFVRGFHRRRVGGYDTLTVDPDAVEIEWARPWNTLIETSRRSNRWRQTGPTRRIHPSPSSVALFKYYYWHMRARLSRRHPHSSSRRHGEPLPSDAGNPPLARAPIDRCAIGAGLQLHDRVGLGVAARPGSGIV